MGLEFSFSRRLMWKLHCPFIAHKPQIRLGVWNSVLGSQQLAQRQCLKACERFGIFITLRKYPGKWLSDPLIMVRENRTRAYIMDIFQGSFWSPPCFPLLKKLLPVNDFRIGEWGKIEPICCNGTWQPFVPQTRIFIFIFDFLPGNYVQLTMTILWIKMCLLCLSYCFLW